MTELYGKIIMTDDRRIAVRREVKKSAQALAPNAHEPVSCMILDISVTGARIALASEACFLPKKLKLYIRDMHVIAECEQKWRKGREVGLEFIATTKIVQPSPTEDAADAGPGEDPAD